MYVKRAILPDLALPQFPMQLVKCSELIFYQHERKNQPLFHVKGLEFISSIIDRFSATISLYWKMGSNSHKLHVFDAPVAEICGLRFKDFINAEKNQPKDPSDSDGRALHYAKLCAASQTHTTRTTRDIQITSNNWATFKIFTSFQFSLPFTKSVRHRVTSVLAETCSI